MQDTLARSEPPRRAPARSTPTLPWGFAPRRAWADSRAAEQAPATGRWTPAAPASDPASQDDPGEVAEALAGTADDALLPTEEGRPMGSGHDEPVDLGGLDPIEVLSHELRSPITTIHLGTKMLRSGRTVKDPVRSAVVEAVEVEAERLYRLVEDLLAVARHDGGREPLPVQPTLLQRAVPPILAAESAAHEGTPIRAFLPADLPPVRADEAALEHVLRNVIGNAVRFSPPGSPIEVAATEEEGAVALRIADRGPGIDPAEADRLFEPFYRSARTAATPGGAGLGLAAARRLLQAMDGTIDAAPGPGGGGVVTMRFASEAQARA